eukprot:1161206-Pelagomonas_calceolata.AAC.1
MSLEAKLLGGSWIVSCIPLCLALSNALWRILMVLKAWRGSGQYLHWGEEFTTSSPNNVCLCAQPTWVCGINIKGGLVAE